VSASTRGAPRYISPRHLELCRPGISVKLATIVIDFLMPSKNQTRGQPLTSVFRSAYRCSNLAGDR